MFGRSAGGGSGGHGRSGRRPRGRRIIVPGLGGGAHGAGKRSGGRGSGKRGGRGFARVIAVVADRQFREIDFLVHADRLLDGRGVVRLGHVSVAVVGV